jgi:hypothetical protein
MRHFLWLGLIAIGWIGLAVSAANADEPGAIKKPTPAELARWVQELDSDAYPVREAATENLVAAGTAAIEPLASAVLSDSAEVAWRAGTSLQRIAVHGDETTLNQVSTALQKLSSKRPTLTKLVSDIKVQQQKFRHKRAIAKVRGLGGNLSGNWEGDELAFAGDVVPAMAAMEVVEFEAAPAIIVGDAAPIPAPIDPFDDPKAEDDAPVARGIFGVIARLFAPGAPADPIPIPILPDAPPPLAVPIELAPVPVAPAAPAEALPRFEAPALPEGPAPEPAPAPADAVEVIADAIAIEAFAGPVMIGDIDGGGESEAYAELVLGKSFQGKDADLAVLKDIPEIYSLTIQGAKLSDKALDHIAELKRLTTLNVRETEFSSAALRKLRQKRPELSIVCRSTAMLGINAGLEGACILSSVFHRSGAAEAGLKEGDEIIEVGGQKVRDFSDLTIAVYPHKPGDKLNVKFRRSGEEKTVVVVLKPRVDVE